MDQLEAFVTHLVVTAHYPGLFIVMMLGSLGIPIGTEIVLPAAGAYTARGLLGPLWATIAVAVAGETLGAWMLYGIGRAGGPRVVARFGRYIGLDARHLEELENFYLAHGAKATFLLRLLPFLRAAEALPAGAARMPVLRFVAFDAAGSLVFCSALIGLGHQFGKHVGALTSDLRTFTLAVAVLTALAAVWFVAWRRRHSPRQSAGRLAKNASIPSRKSRLP